MTPERLAAIVPAAGLGSRMRAVKPLLPLGPQTALARVVRLFREAGVSDVVVTVGHEAQAVAAEAMACGVLVVHNENYLAGMFSSVQAGISALPEEVEAFFVLPVDVPLVRPAVLRLLAQALGSAQAGVLAARPTFRGRPGHPPLISRLALPAILDHAGNHGGQGGLAGALAMLPGGVLDVAVYDAGVLMDMDRRSDYRRILARLERLEVPTRAECAAFLAGMSGRGLAHARAVARCAVTMGEAVNAGRPAPRRLDLELVRHAALLHDIAKGSPGHEAEGGRLLAAWGFSRAAEVVAAHRDPVPTEGEPVNEREVVALADKLARGARPVSIEERFDEKLRRFAHDPEAVAAILRRRDNALRVKARIEAETGRLLQDILSRET
jgi:CTP:molybdopterin cytidylyltransferase MocA